MVNKYISSWGSTHFKGKYILITALVMPSFEKVFQSNLRMYKWVSWSFVTIHVPWDYCVPRVFHHLHQVNARVGLNGVSPKHTVRVFSDGEVVTSLENITSQWNLQWHLLSHPSIHFVIFTLFKRVVKNTNLQGSRCLLGCLCRRQDMNFNSDNGNISMQITAFCSNSLHHSY